MLISWSYKDIGIAYQQRIGFTDNWWQNTLSKVRKPIKIGEEKKTLISAFV